MASLANTCHRDWELVHGNVLGPRISFGINYAAAVGSLDGEILVGFDASNREKGS